MSARIPRHQDVTFDDLGEAVNRADGLCLFHSILSILHPLAMLMNRKVIFPRLDKDFIIIEYSCWIDDANEHTGVGKQNPCLLLQIHELIELHAVQNGGKHRVFHDLHSFDERLLQSGLK